MYNESEMLLKASELGRCWSILFNPTEAQLLEMPVNV